MVKRFNNLDAALRYLRPTSAEEGAEIPDAPTGTPLRKYQDYKAGKVDLDYPRAATSLPGNLKVITLKPFALAAADTTVIKSSISARALEDLGDFALSIAVLAFDDPADSAGIDTVGFTPAKAICRNVTGTTAATKTSKLTGLPYKSKTNTSSTFPVGRHGTDFTWGAQKGKITTAVAGSSGNKSVSFKPERF